MVLYPDTYPRPWVNPVTMRLLATVLRAAPLWDLVPIEIFVTGARGMSVQFTYTRAAAGGAFDFQARFSQYSIAGLVPAGAGEWATETLYAAGGVAAGVETQSRLQTEYQTYQAVTANAETPVYTYEFGVPMERMLIDARESGGGAVGTLIIVAEIW